VGEKKEKFYPQIQGVTNSKAENLLLDENGNINVSNTIEEIDRDG
jgi:hypothetical protein